MYAARIILLLSLGLLVCGCRDRTLPGDRLARTERIVVLVPETLRGTLDPRLNTRAWPGKIIQVAFEGITSVQNETLEPRPALAETITLSDSRTYEITLRPTARFADGRAVTTADVEATLQSTRDPLTRSRFKSIFDRIETIECLDERRMRIRLKAPHAPFLSDLSIGILPASSLGADSTGPLVGAGPYRILSQTGTREVVLERNPYYWRGRPKTRYLVFRAVTDPSTRLLAVMSGAADLVQNSISPRMIEAMRDRPQVAVDSQPGVGYSYVAFNLRKGPLSQLEVRQAIALSVDRKALIKHKFRGVARRARSMLPEGHWAYAPDARIWELDRTEAERLLDKAGFPRGANGVRFKLGFKVTTDKFRRNIAKLIARDLGRVGIEVKVQPLELGTMLTDVKGGNFDLYMLQWGDPSEPHLYNWIFHSQRVPTASAPNRGGNRGGYRNLEVDALIDQGRITTDRTQRAIIYRRLQRLVAEELPYLSLWHEDVLVARNSRLTGYKALPNASLFNLWRAGWP